MITKKEYEKLKIQLDKEITQRIVDSRVYQKEIDRLKTGWDLERDTNRDLINKICEYRETTNYAIREYEKLNEKIQKILEYVDNQNNESDYIKNIILG